MRFLVGVRRIHLAQRTVLDCIVVFLNKRHNLGRRQTCLFSDFFARVGLTVRAVQDIEFRNNFVEHRACRVDDDPAGVIQCLLSCGSSFNHIGVVFIHVTITGSIDLNTITGVQNVSRIDVGCTDNRTGMELVHVDALSIQRKRQGNVFTSCGLGAAKHHAGSPAADVFIDHFRIGREAAGCNGNAALGEVFFLSCRCLNLHAGNTHLVVMKKFNTFVLELNFNTFFSGSRKKFLNELCTACETFAVNTTGTAETRIRHRTNLAELNADIFFQPVNTGGNVISVSAVQSLIAHLFGNVHHHGVEIVGSIFDALLFLMTRAPAANGAQSKNSVPVGTVAFFEYNYFLCTSLLSGDGSDQSGRTGPEHDHVISIFIVLGGCLCCWLCCVGSAHERSKTGCHRAN